MRNSHTNLVYLFVGVVIGGAVVKFWITFSTAVSEPNKLSSDVPKWNETEPEYVSLQSGTYEKLSEFIRVKGVKKDQHIIEYAFPDSITIIDLIETEDDTLLAVWSPIPTDTVRCKYGCRMFYSILPNDSASARLPDTRKYIALIRPTIDSMLVRISR